MFYPIFYILGRIPLMLTPLESNLCIDLYTPQLQCDSTVVHDWPQVHQSLGFLGKWYPTHGLPHFSQVEKIHWTQLPTATRSPDAWQLSFPEHLYKNRYLNSERQKRVVGAGKGLGEYWAKWLGEGKVWTGPCKHE